MAPWLGIYAAPLEDITALERARPPVLGRLDLASCRRLTSLEPIGGLHRLRELDVNEGGTLASLTPIAALAGLQRPYLHGSTTMVDADLSPLLGLHRMTDLRMMNRRQYAPSVNDVRAQLASSNGEEPRHIAASARRCHDPLPPVDEGDDQRTIQQRDPP